MSRRAAAGEAGLFPGFQVLSAGTRDTIFSRNCVRKLRENAGDIGVIKPVQEPADSLHTPLPVQSTGPLIRNRELLAKARVLI